MENRTPITHSAKAGATEINIKSDINLKVDSCPNNNSSGQIFICPFPCSI